MASPQHKIGSGFGAHTTAAEVLNGIDLDGKLAVVTGGYSGLGLEATRALTGAGARVVVPARRPDVAAGALADIAGTEVAALDLGDLDSVRAFAERFLESGRELDIVIDNAGIMATPETRVGPGWEAQFATNHLGHFALVNRLWPAIAPGGARVVSVSSRGHHRSGIRWDDVQFEHGYDKWEAYGQAKTANVLFAVELDRLGADAGVRAFSVHPGGIMTPLQRHLPREEMVALGWLDEQGNPTPEAAAQFKTPEQGAATEVWAATSPQLDGMGGVYLEDCDVAEVAPESGERVGVKDYAIDPEQAQRLWALSGELTGVDAFAPAG
ncbi:MAG TPA: SDR family NAD(P)-dependent oxidoreductase [Solirubrobacteraceae bacterium]|nr:SDR family NAD(P)-dependent oxidoreductase [Solirubrobacteraceae bacterium]